MGNFIHISFIIPFVVKMFSLKIYQCHIIENKIEIHLVSKTLLLYDNFCDHKITSSDLHLKVNLKKLLCGRNNHLILTSVKLSSSISLYWIEFSASENRVCLLLRKFKYIMKWHHFISISKCVNTSEEKYK